MPSDALSQAVQNMLERIASADWPSGDGAATGFDFYREPGNFIGTDLDHLSDASPEERWDDAQREAHRALGGIQPRHKLAVLAMARDEALYLPEWMSHCLAIGSEHIFVYTNDNSDGTDELLRWFSGQAPVTPLFTTAAKGVNIQRKNYQHALFLLPELRLYEWVMVIDVDEFPVPAERFGFHLPTLLDAAPSDAAAVVFPWLWRLWDVRFERGPGLLAERFPHALPHALFKSAVRIRQAVSLCEVHIPTLHPGAKIIDTAFAATPLEDIWNARPKTSAGGWIDHYWGRSFEEFLTKKTRGDLLEIPTGQFKREFQTYFTWTKPLCASNYTPVPPQVLENTKATLRRFQGDPTFADLMQGITRRAADNAAALRTDRKFIDLFDGFLKRPT